MASSKPPAYRRHKATGLAVVTLFGKDRYLGPHGSEGSRSAYAKAIAEWSSGRPAAMSAPTVADLCRAFNEHAKSWYAKSGRPTTGVGLARRVCRALAEMAGNSPASSFSPMDLVALRSRWLAEGASRTTANSYVRWTRYAFRWGVGRGIVPGETWHALRAVEGLPKGRGGRETAGIGPADPGHVAAVLAVAEPDVAAMIRVQLLGGMRPGEVAAMKASEVDRGSEPWVYRPGGHKAEHHGKERAIAIGPAARAILGPWLDRAGAGFAFPEGALRAAMRCSEADPGRRLAATYGRAVRAACRKAGVPEWGPNRLRHSAATEIRRRHGIEAARAVLGHSSPTTTLIYAERDLDAVRKIAEEMG